MLSSSSGVPDPLRLSKSTSFPFSPGCQLQAPAHRSYCPVSLVSSTPCMHCVCTLVRMARAGYLAVLGSLSLPTLTPLLLPGVGVRGARVPLDCGLYLTPFARYWIVAGVDVVWLLSCVFWSLFKEELYLLYFQKYMWFWEEISTALLMPPSWFCSPLLGFYPEETIS